MKSTVKKVKRLKSQNIFYIFIKKAVMIDEKKKMYEGNQINLSNAYKIFLKNENP